ncbi:MAG: hypothetical protein HKO76_10755 [Acidimicrobiia bacterium]|nr:hypothetical protein [Acidimicrobiia bacterium]
MGLADELEQATDANLWKQLCGVHKAMEEHPDQADIIFDFCTNRTDKAGTSLSRTFTSHGIRISGQTIVRHRKGACACSERMPERYDS